MSGDIKFTPEEWSHASDLACFLLENLWPQRMSNCEQCCEERILLPNYKMKYELAKMLRASAGQPDGK